MNGIAAVVATSMWTEPGQHARVLHAPGLVGARVPTRRPPVAGVADRRPKVLIEPGRLTSDTSRPGDSLVPTPS